uniref:C2H2-type domain-containing protein n=1 Tax=Solanum lycopersicum TaxID=4081 RepID=A0A3Q7GKE6_SOLLC
MHNANFSPFSGPSPILHFCTVCNEMFHTYSEFVNHIQITHPLSSEQDIILHSSVYASVTFLPGNPLSTQPAAPRNVRPERNNNIVIMPTPSSNLNHPMISRDRALPIDRQLMARRNWFVPIRRGTTPIMDREQMEKRNMVESSREAIADRTIPLIDQLDVPISSNANELINIDEEHIDLDLELRL